MNRYFLNTLTNAVFPKKSNNPFIQELFNRFTLGKKLNIDFSSADNLILIENGKPLLEEGKEFTINVTEEGIAIKATGYPALMNGYATLLELMETDKKKSTSIALGTYSDKGTIGMRSAHLCIFPETKPEFLRKCIRSCCMAKYTHIVLEFWGMIKYDCLKELSWSFALEKSAVKELVKEANAMGVEIIPMFNHLGHASGCRMIHGKHTVLDQNPDLEYMFKNYGWEWNYSDKEVYDLLAKVRDELIEVCGEGSYFHIGCDEAYAACLDEESVEEMTGYINRLSAELKAKGRRAIMWGDMLLCVDDISKMEGTYYANSKREVSDYLLNNLSKDIIIADWQYEAYDDVWKTTELLKNYDFDLLCCPWDSEENIVSAVKTADSLGTMGIMETTWHTLIRVFPLMVFAGYYAYSYKNKDSVHPLYKGDLAKDSFRCHSAHIVRKVSPSGGEYINGGWAELSVGAGL